MAIWDLLSAEKRRERRLERVIRRVNNKHTPKDYRQAALHELIEEARKGNERALRGLVDRFSVNAEPSIEDEREKDWVCETLVDIGEPALPLLRKALRGAESVNWVQRTFRNIVDGDQYKAELLEVLSEFDTEYERNPDRKIQTIMALADTPGREVAEALTRFLEDVDETVRFQTVVALAKQGDDLARERLLEAMCGDESIRVRNEVVEAFADLGWSTSGFKKKVDAVLPAGFRHDKSGRIVKLAKG